MQITSLFLLCAKTEIQSRDRRNLRDLWHGNLRPLRNAGKETSETYSNLQLFPTVGTR
ncbi:MAG: hypothetical protein R6U96_17910 [Promethearchaeia archaeon]